MSLLARIGTANRHDPAAYLPFRVEDVGVGSVRPEFARRLATWRGVFRLAQGCLRLAPDLDRPGTPAQARSAAVAEVLEHLRGEGEIPGWRGELYPAAPGWGARPLLLIERAAVPRFGVTGYGVHLNGYVRSASGLALWVARRSADKPTDPGKLDHLVAGGQPAGMGLLENLVKECREEADLRPHLAHRAVATGMVRYICEVPGGLRPDVVFTFDLELPASFRPRNRDGEVASFELWPVEQVAEILRETDDFKFNCALVLIDFLARHGLLDPMDGDYPELLAGLRPSFRDLPR
jgi:hypothetical protein